MLPIPNVSVCIPVYNDERFLGEALRSVLDQTYPEFELVVLDNASTDRTAEIVRSFPDPRIRYSRNPETVPQAENWNRVMELARAPLVKLLCSDDLLHPRCLEFQVAAMDADPGLAVVAVRRHMIDEQTRILAPRRGLGSGLVGAHPAEDVAKRVVRSGSNPLGEPGAVLMRRDDFFAVGGWRADRTYIMDLDLWMRLLRHGDFLGIPQTLAAFRIREGSVSATSDTLITQQQRMLTTELGDSADFAVGAFDRAIGSARVPLGNARRRLLFTIMRRARSRTRTDSTYSGGPESRLTIDA